VKFGFYELLSMNPWVYINTVISAIIKHCNSSITVNQLATDVELNTLCFFASANIFPHTDNPEGIYINPADFVPHITIDKLLKALWNTFAVKIYRGFFDDSVKIIRMNNFVSQMPAEDLTSFCSPMPEINYRNLVTGLKFIPVWEPDDTYYINQVQDIAGKELLGTYATTGNLPSVGLSNYGMIAYITSSSLYYISKSTGWEFYSRNIQAYSIGTEPMTSIDEQTPGILTTNVVETQPSASFYMPKSTAEEFKKDNLMFAFYRGMHEEPTFEVDFPYGSSNIYWKSDGTVFPGVQYSIRNHGDTGLIVKHWQKYIDWRLRSLPVNFEMEKSLSEVAAMDLSKKYRINKSDYFINSLAFDLELETDKISRIKASCLSY
jgi:hypothetical protein